MTYLEAACDIIEMYNIYAIKCASGGRPCGNHSEAVAMAVEALSIVAGLNNDTKTHIASQEDDHAQNN